jgi:hypothetical protein
VSILLLLLASKFSCWSLLGFSIFCWGFLFFSLLFPESFFSSGSFLDLEVDLEESFGLFFLFSVSLFSLTFFFSGLFLGFDFASF